LKPKEYEPKSSKHALNNIDRHKETSSGFFSVKVNVLLGSQALLALTFVTTMFSCYTKAVPCLTAEIVRE